MTREEIEAFINANRITYNCIKFSFKNCDSDFGYFDHYDDYEKLKNENKWRYIPNDLAQNYNSTKDLEFTRIVRGEDIETLTLVK